MLPAGVVAYGYAWTGHFFVAHNRPATFQYLRPSLLGDFCLCADLWCGREQVLTRLIPALQLLAHEEVR